MFAYNPMRLNIGSIGFLPASSDPVLVSPDYVVFGCGESIIPEYLNYYTQSGKWFDWVAAGGTGSVRSRIYFKELARLSIVVPSKRDQLGAVEVLANLDALERALVEEDSLILRTCLTLFEGWFTRFEPVKMNADGRVGIGIHASAQQLFPRELMESDAGMIPKGWKSGTLANVAILNEKAWSKKDHPSTIRYVDLGAVKDNRIEMVPEYSFEEAPSRARRVVNVGDTIVGTVRPGNRSFAYIGPSLPGLTASTGFAVLTPIEPCYREFVYLAATRSESIERLAKLADGAAYPAVRPEVVLQTEVVLPPESIVREFSDCVGPLFARLVKNRDSARSVSGLRQTLLPKLLAGTVRLSEPHKLLTEAIA
jgi:type I restriction enzyme S subunit